MRAAVQSLDTFTFSLLVDSIVPIQIPSALIPGTAHVILGVSSNLSLIVPPNSRHFLVKNISSFSRFFKSSLSIWIPATTPGSPTKSCPPTLHLRPPRMSSASSPTAAGSICAAAWTGRLTISTPSLWLLQTTEHPRKRRRRASR